MQYTKICTILCTLFFAIVTYAQPGNKPVRGTILFQNKPLQGATVTVNNSSTQTDQSGNFTIQVNPNQALLFVISAIGTETLIRELPYQHTGYSFNLQAAKNELETVEVLGITKAQEVNRQAFNVTAVDASKLYNSTLDIAGALDKVAGVRVRESGGVGSNFNLSLNGFSGNHIRYFLDGIPMDNFGTSFQINNIPINLAERIEVYKGVVPMWLGSDALGGAINIVTSNTRRNFVDASYSYGSFNTHRTVVNTAFTNKKGLTFQLNAYQNYSDNDYRVTVDAADIFTGAYTLNARVKRFNDKYHNESLIAQVGVVDKPYADRLLFGITLGQNYKEIQTGARMSTVFGALHRRGNTIMPTLKYKKDNLIKGLDVILNANYNLGSEQNIDTVNARFDWYGNQKPNGANGERNRQIYKYKNNEGLANATFNYRITDRHSIALNNVFTTFKREGKDLLNPQNSFYEIPQRMNKNIMGLGYTYDEKDRWSATAFVKYINLLSKNGDDKTTTDRIGAGMAATYFLNSNLQLKTSYEMTNRMATAFELYGDVENQDANKNLKPEKSHNANLGAIYGFQMQQDHRFQISANAIYRYATDFIYNRLNQNQSKLIADNRKGVTTIGADADMRYSFKNFLNIGGTLTYQYIQNKQKYEPEFTGISPVYNDQMPNIPYFYGNADASVIWRNFAGQGNNLNIGYNLNYVHKFFLYWPSRGGEKLEIPKQLSHDVNAVYSLNNGRYNVGLELKNITNTNLYDNFSLQKPGRAVYVNFRYFINK